MFTTMSKVCAVVFGIALLSMSAQTQAEIVSASMRGNVRQIGSSFTLDYGNSANGFIMGNSSGTSSYRGAFEFSGFTSSEWITGANFVFTRGSSSASTVSMDMWSVATDLTTLAANAASFNDLGSGTNYGSGSVVVGGSSSTTSSLAFASAGLAALNSANVDSQTFQLGTSFGGIGFANNNAGGVMQIDTTTTGNSAPVANSDSAIYEIVIGEAVTVSALTSTDVDVLSGDALFYEWDLDNNGSFETSSMTGTATNSVATITGLGDFTAVLRVTDRWGDSTTTTFTLTATPEPGTIISFGLVAVAIGFRRRKIA